MKPFLILQLRPETDASDAEFASIIARSGLSPERVRRIRLDRETLPEALDVTDYAGVIVGGGPGCVSDPVDSKPPTEARIEAAILSLMPQITARDHPY
ncbi:glutamine amidotransferase, partial [Cribrihabitans sp. XS_ASV171]